MLTIIVLLIQDEKIFEFNHKEIFVKVRGSSMEVSAKVNIRGVAAWGFNILGADFTDVLKETIRDILVYNARGSKELVSAYMRTI